MAIDKLNKNSGNILNCPDENVRKADACAPLYSLAGYKYMFSQSRYDNLEKSLPSENRPAWFLKDYYNIKCCDLPPLFNVADLAMCGFNTIVNYYKYYPSHTTHTTPVTLHDTIKTGLTEPSSNHIDTSTPVNVNTAKMVHQCKECQQNHKDTSIRDDENYVHMVDLNLLNKFNFSHNHEDPLNCCNMDEFILPAWRSECGFELNYSEDERLFIVNTTLIQPSTTTATPIIKPRVEDIKVLPLSCETETRIFRRLDIVSESGAVNKDAFMKLLNNITKNSTEWNKAKARVFTKCLSKPILDYVYECEINKVLACTFDVLSENCPNAPKYDPCKHTHMSRNLSKTSNDTVTCQISTSKYGILIQKNRRHFCELPTFVNSTVLKECGATTFFKTEIVPELPRRYQSGKWFSSKFICKELTQSTKCLLKKMGVLNKYGFMDYFKMKDQIRRFTSSNVDWSTFTDIYMSRFTTIPLYKEHCSSPKKLLNIFDVMLSTCPMSQRKDTERCNLIFEDIIQTPRQTFKKHLNLWGNFKPSTKSPLPAHPSSFDTYKLTQSVPSRKRVHMNHLYDFGILNSKNAPPVSIIDIKPKQGNDYENRTPSVILPVYLRSDRYHGSLSRWPNGIEGENMLRSADAPQYKRPL